MIAARLLDSLARRHYVYVQQAQSDPHNGGTGMRKYTMGCRPHLPRQSLQTRQPFFIPSLPWACYGLSPDFLGVLLRKRWRHRQNTECFLGRGFSVRFVFHITRVDPSLAYGQIRSHAPPQSDGLHLSVFCEKKVSGKSRQQMNFNPSTK